jgi:hypothetical protein
MRFYEKRTRTGELGGGRQARRKVRGGERDHWGLAVLSEIIFTAPLPRPCLRAFCRDKDGATSRYGDLERLGQPP